jgi:hypothetical protein
MVNWLSRNSEVRRGPSARSDRRIDKRSGFSQRMAITVLECVASNAERRADDRGYQAAEAPACKVCMNGDYCQHRRAWKPISES